MVGRAQTSATYRRPAPTVAVQKQATICAGCPYCAPETLSHPSSIAATVPTNAFTAVKSQAVRAGESELTLKRLFDRIATALASLNGPETLRPLIFPNIRPHQWDEFTRRYANHPALAYGAKWEYDANRYSIIVVALATPFHDIACSIMAIQHTRLFAAGVDTQRRFERLKVNRSRMSKQTTDGGRSDREPDCAVLAVDYHRAIPTIVWEVGHSQGMQALVKRAKMWCRRYDGNIRVVILVKYLRKNPRVDKAALLWVYRPQRQGDGRWTAVQQGPVYTLFPVPEDAGSPEDVIPLTYEDYFGPGNVGFGVEPRMRCDLALDLVRQEIEEGIQNTLAQDQYRHVSGGSSIAGAAAALGAEGGVGVVAAELEGEVEMAHDDREGSPEGEAYQEYGEDWDAAMSDVSDA